jgi:hypothetical protein
MGIVFLQIWFRIKFDGVCDLLQSCCLDRKLGCMMADKIDVLASSIKKKYFPFVPTTQRSTSSRSLVAVEKPLCATGQASSVEFITAMIAPLEKRKTAKELLSLFVVTLQTNTDSPLLPSAKLLSVQKKKATFAAIAKSDYTAQNQGEISLVAGVEYTIEDQRSIQRGVIALILFYFFFLLFIHFSLAYFSLLLQSYPLGKKSSVWWKTSIVARSVTPVAPTQHVSFTRSLSSLATASLASTTSLVATTLASPAPLVVSGWFPARFARRTDKPSAANIDKSHFASIQKLLAKDSGSIAEGSDSQA